MVHKANVPTGPIRLAHVAPFRLGAIGVHPPTRQVVRDGRSETLEPRVMQVLVALAQAQGAILTRDELIERCWDGRIVSENAINRVISRVRHIAAELGPDAFQLETITKVGYRIVTSDLLPGPTPSTATTSPPRVNRRLALAGGAAAIGLAATGAFLWTRPRGHVPTPEARAFYDQGMRAQYQGITDTAEQAEAYFRQAVAADPLWADAWGSLAMSYRHLLDGETDRGQWQLVQRTVSAARRALELDPDNAEALVALALVRSPYRHWVETERRYRRLLARFPEAFVLQGHFSRLLQDVGRMEEAVAISRAQTGQQPFVNGASISYANALWGAGRLQEAESEMERGISRWPRHAGVWFNRFAFLTYTGRAGSAAAFASDVDGRPPGIPEPIFANAIATARALERRAPADIDAAARTMLSFLPGPGDFGVTTALPFFVAIGDLETAFALIDAHFFDRGRFARSAPVPVGALTRRNSSFLFRPTAAPLRTDPRFAAVLEGTGLEAYWRETGTRPDYRRG